MELDKPFWSARYAENKTGWDIGYPAPQLVALINKIDKSKHILIPGCGNGYEAEYAFNNGFTNVFVVDICEQPLRNLKIRCPNFPSNHLICSDFFDISGKFDVIIEQTFFCALNPNLRSNYVNKCFDLLNTNGMIAGLLFDDESLIDGPPFGGSRAVYEMLFGKRFIIKTINTADLSIEPRKLRELYFEFVKSK